MLRYLKLLRVRRLLEAGAGRGYLSAALAPLAPAAGLVFKAIDKGEGEFLTGLPVHHLVEPGDVFAVVRDFRPGAVLYAWPPPGQSLAPLVESPGVRYLIVIGEAGGGVTGAQEDWLALPHKPSDGAGPLQPQPHRRGPASGDGFLAWRWGERGLRNFPKQLLMSLGLTRKAWKVWWGGPPCPPWSR